METELIKPIVKLGNSAGVVLPRKWLNKQVVIRLTILDIKTIIKRVIEILIEKKFLNGVLGIYLIGSYARNEQKAESDIDILVITDKITNELKVENYSIVLISKENLEESLVTNPIYYYPMIKEAKIIINPELIDNYKKYPLTRKGVLNFIKSTKRLLLMNKDMISIDKQLNNTKTGDPVAYSLILRLRSIYILESIIKNRLWNEKELLKIIDSQEVYERYKAIKESNKNLSNTILIKDAERLIRTIELKVRGLEKWAKERVKEEKGKRD